MVSDDAKSWFSGALSAFIFSFIFFIRASLVSFSSASTSYVAAFLASLCFFKYLPKNPDGSSFEPTSPKSDESAIAYVMSEGALSPLALTFF